MDECVPLDEAHRLAIDLLDGCGEEEVVEREDEIDQVEYVDVHDGC